MKMEIEVCDECEDTSKDTETQCAFCKRQFCKECQTGNTIEIINEKSKAISICSNCVQEWHDKIRKN